MRSLTRSCLLSLALLTATAVGGSAAPFADNKKDENANLRAVQGLVTDSANNPLAQAIVQIKDTKSLQVRSFITKDDGSYHFYGLSPNIDYELKAEFQAGVSDKKTLSSFDSRKTATLNLVVKPKK